MCGFMAMKVVEKWEKQWNVAANCCLKSVERSGDNGGSAPTENMTGREWWWRWSDETDEQGESDGEDEKHDPKNEKESLKFIVSPNPVGDNGGSVPTIGWAHANDDDETERELFKFVVSPNRELWRVSGRLPVKNLFISVNFDVFMLNFTVQFEFIAEIMKIESKYVTAMFAAFQNVKHGAE